MARSVLVLGGGIAGLSVAREIDRRGGDVLLLEGSPRLGGMVRTDRSGGVVFECGPQGFLGDHPGVLDHVEDLGLADRLVPARETASRRYLFHENRLLPLPMSPPAFLTTPLLSLRGKLRVLREPWAKPAPNGEESVREFASRRIGEEAADRLVDAAVTGIFAGDPSRLSVDACFPKMRTLEREHGGLFRGMRAKRKEGAGPGGKRLHSFRGGMEELAEAFARRLEGRTRTTWPIERIERSGSGWRAVGPRGSQEAERVVVALPAPGASLLLEEVTPGISAWLRDLFHAPVAVLGLVFDRERVGHPLDGYGFLATGGREPVLGCLFESSVFPERAPEGRVLLRVMIGGARNPEEALRPEDELRDSALAFLRPLLELEGEPAETRFVAYERAIPQYPVGHAARIRDLQRELADVPGLVLAGSAFRGVAVNHLVGESARLAESALA